MLGEISKARVSRISALLIAANEGVDSIGIKIDGKAALEAI